MRLHAAEWHVDPHKIGVLGFSGGGHLVAEISTHYDQRLCPVTVWPQLAETWLATIGMISEPAAAT